MKSIERNILQDRNHWTSTWLVGVTWMVVLAATFLAGSGARAQNQWYWAVGTDVYNDPNAWSPVGVPSTTSDYADVSDSGTVNYNTGMTYALGTLTIGGAFGTGTFMMNGGELDITNTSSTTLFSPGNAGNGSFIMGGGTLNIARPSNGTAYYQDGASPGNIQGGTGTITLNNGTFNIWCGMEIGKNGGAGIINVNGGTMVANGWFTCGYGNTPSVGTFNLTGGTLYILRNFGNNGGATGNAGLRIMLNTGTGVANISGGTLYTERISIGNQNNAGTGILNVSGGDIYIGDAGVVCGANNASQVKAINLSGGNFRTVNMDPNSTGQKGLSTILTGGTNWTWASANLPAVNLTNNPGAGITAFIPDAGKTITLAAQFTGVGGLNFNGPGTNLLQAANTYTGGTTLSQGTLAFGSGGSIPDSTLTIPSGAAVAFASGNAVQNYNNNFTGPGNVYVTGTADIYGSLGHSGQTVVSAGTLALATALNNTPSVTVTNTGSLAGIGPVNVPVTVASTTQQGAHLRMGMSPLNIPATLTINNNVSLGVGSELDIKLVTATTVGGGVNDLLVVNGNLTINPNAFLNILPLQQLTAGTYVIATYTGTLTGQFTNSFPGFRYGLTLDYSTTGQIKLNVTGSNANLTWIGVTNNVAANNWDVTTTPNWTNPATLSADIFGQGDAVTFDDTTRNTNVVLAAALYPSSITFNGNTNWSVTGTGSGQISGDTGITKNGNGTVLLAAGLGVGNNYTGPVNINGGVLKMNGALSLGATNGATIVASGATLDLNGQTPNDEPMVLQGAGYGGTNGAINNSSATSPSQNNGPRRVTLAGDTTINASGSRWDMGFSTLGAGGGSFAGNGYTLTKIGAQQIWLHELGDIGVGNIVVNQSTLGFEYTIGLGDPTKTITVMPGATFGIWQAPTLSKQVVLTNGATLYSDGASNALTGTITLFGTNTVQANTAFDILSPIVGAGGFHKTGTAPLYLSAANTYSGPTFIDAGSVVLGASGSIANSSLINVASGTTLDVSQTVGLSLGNGQMIAGSGSVLGNVSAGTGAQIAPGTAVAAGTLGFANNLTLNGATNVIKLSGNPSTVGGGVNDLVSVTNTLTLNGISTIQITPLGVLSTTAPYTVMQYGAGTPSAANLRVVSSSARYTIGLVNPATTPGTIQVTITGNPGLLVWKGGAASKPNIWDNATTNWFNLSTGLRDAYFSGDNTIFDDTASTNIINLATSALGLISLSNNATAYTLTGNGLINAALDMEGTGSYRLAVSNAPAFPAITANSGTLIFDLQNGGGYTNYATISDNGAGLSTILKAGSNTMVLSAPDNSSFSGTMIISNGILQYTNVLDLGMATSPLYATNNGSLDIQSIPTGLKNIIIAGNGYNGLGAVMDSGPGLANEGVHTLTLAGDASIGASNRFDIYGGTGGTVNGNGFKLTEVGPGTHLFNAIGATALGDIHIVHGRLGFQGATDMGDPSKTLTIESNAILTFYAVSPAVSKNLVLNGNATFDSGGSANTFNGAVRLVGNSNLFGLRVPLYLEGNISGAGSFVVGTSPVGAGPSTLYLDGNNTYTGSTTISNGFGLTVGASSSLGASSLIQVDNGATLDVFAPASFSFGAGQTLIGSGTVIGGNVVFGAGSTLAPGFPDNNTYNLTMNSTLTLQSGSTNLVVVNKTGSVANDAVTGLTSVMMGGTLVINSVGSPLAGGDAIPLFFASGGYIGSYDKIIPATPGGGLAWDLSTLNSDGNLRVLRTGPPTTPTNMLFSVSANQLTLSWPSAYTGWTLQGQTNNPSVGLTTNWHDVPGSTTTNQVVMPIGEANGSVFFRMILK
jgi:autotransporter-associated beta strand protein